MSSRLELTVKRFAEREQVTERTVYRWIQKGAVQIRRTPSGGVRIVLLRESDVTNDDKPRHPYT